MTENYKYIRAWGSMMGSRDYYIRDQIEKAHKDKAPPDAIYWDGKRWHVFADVTRQETRTIIEQSVAD